MRRGWPQQPLTPAVVLPNDGAPFAALNPLRNARSGFQSRERSGPKARESERFERLEAGVLYPIGIWNPPA